MGRVRPEEREEKWSGLTTLSLILITIIPDQCCDYYPLTHGCLAAFLATSAASVPSHLAAVELNVFLLATNTLAQILLWVWYAFSLKVRPQVWHWHMGPEAASAWRSSGGMLPKPLAPATGMSSTALGGPAGLAWGGLAAGGAARGGAAAAGGGAWAGGGGWGCAAGGGACLWGGGCWGGGCR